MSFGHELLNLSDSPIQLRDSICVEEQISICSAVFIFKLLNHINLKPLSYSQCRGCSNLDVDRQSQSGVMHVQVGWLLLLLYLVTFVQG